MDLESRRRRAGYSRAKDVMFPHTDIKQAPWYAVAADVKNRARLNCISHFLRLLPYEDLTPEAIDLPPRNTGSWTPALTLRRRVIGLVWSTSVIVRLRGGAHQA